MPSCSLALAATLIALPPTFGPEVGAGWVDPAPAHLFGDEVEPCARTRSRPVQTPVCRRDRLAAHLTEAPPVAGVLRPADTLCEPLREGRRVPRGETGDRR